MNEQLRTEAEKVLELNNVSCSTLKNAQSLDGKGNWLDKVIDAMLDFHAQQSKRDITDEEIETLASNWFESQIGGYTKYDVFKAGFTTGQSQQSKEKNDNFIKAIELLSLIRAQYYDVNSNVKESVSQLLTTLTK